MRIALTGATGFIGRYLVATLASEGHELQCWHRPSSDLGGFDEEASRLQWIEGQLGHEAAASALVDGCDAVVHAALDRPGRGFRGGEGDVVRFAQTNVVGTLQLIEAARAAGCQRFVFVSTCAVHEQILDDRMLDETHPLWPRTHYGAHKAAIEKFVHSYGLGHGYPICAVRPTGVYGMARPLEQSKWFELVSSVVRGEAVTCNGGGKEVHAADVAQAVRVLLAADADKIRGQAYSCYDMYISRYKVAQLTRSISGSGAQIQGEPTQPKHQIETGKLRSLGMEFSGDIRLRETITSMIEYMGQVSSPRSNY